MKTLNELIKKYNRPGPRYTSYPPVPFWANTPDETQWIQHVRETYDQDKGVDLYVHVPYCESLCYYCGCSRIITKDHSVEDKYLSMVLQEWELYQQKLGFTPRVNSLHFGGGTPTFLSPGNLSTLIASLLKNRSHSFIGSIEVDPRTCTKEHLNVLQEYGIQRVSLGIQDFDPVVQETIHRIQPREMVEALVSEIRAHQFNSLNFDLIYGLPRQTVNSINSTMEIVAAMRPDLIAFYSYAHLPGKIKNQRLISDNDLPSPELKRELYETGKRLLMKYGYVDVGMDHFALPGSFLYKAKFDKALHRNFMGYVDKKSPILLGLGPTSISDSSKSFIQNAKDVKEYGDLVKAGKLPISVGHTHSSKDLLVQELILELMCHDEAHLPSVDDGLPYEKEIREELKDFIEDGIIEVEDNLIKVLPMGKGFVRNVAMSFDFYLREQKSNTRFSQTI